MSTKIFNGWRMLDTTLDEAVKKIQAFRRDIAERADALAAERVARIITEAIDEKALRAWRDKPLAEDHLHSIDEVWQSILERQKKIKDTMGRDPTVDFEVTMNIYPLRGDVLGIIHTEQNDWEKAWFGSDGVEFYGYWNNTDRPEETSDAEWLQREQDWDGVLARWSAPADTTGATAAIHDGSVEMPSIEDIMACIPSFEDRLKRNAKAVLRGKRMEAALFGKDPSKLSISVFVSVDMKTSDHFKTKEGQAELAKEEELLIDILPAKITPDMLLGGDRHNPTADNKGPRA